MWESNSFSAKYQGQNEKDNKNEEENLGDISCVLWNSGKTENPRNDRNNKKDNGPA